MAFHRDAKDVVLDDEDGLLDVGDGLLDEEDPGDPKYLPEDRVVGVSKRGTLTRILLAAVLCAAIVGCSMSFLTKRTVSSQAASTDSVQKDAQDQQASPCATTTGASNPCATTPNPRETTMPSSVSQESPCQKPAPEEEKVHDVMWPADYVIPSEGGEFCFYNKLPEDQVYHAIDFKWAASKLSNWVMAMMFTISDEAVSQLRSNGLDLSQPFSCASSLKIAMDAGGYMLFNQGGEDFQVDADKGFLVGKGTARRHALVRWKYSPSPDGQTQVDPEAGFRLRLTTSLRPINVGEAKFATKGGGGNNTINIPPGERAWVHIVQSTLQASNQVWRGEGVEILKVKPIGRLGYRVRILEAAGGGKFTRPDWGSYNFCSLPHPGNLLLEAGDFKEIFSFSFTDDEHWYDVNKRVLIKNGNSYRVEYTYDTTGEKCYTINGFGDCTTGFDLHFLYKEVPGNNEPYPGYIMDVGPWFMRTPNVDSETADRMLSQWREDPSHGPESDTYGCPNGNQSAQYDVWALTGNIVSRISRAASAQNKL